jgi:hypothetical protein
MLTVWGRRNSFNLQKVMWLVGELELPHTHIPAGGSYFEIDVKRPSVPHVEAWYRRLQNGPPTENTSWSRSMNCTAASTISSIDAPFLCRFDNPHVPYDISRTFPRFANAA